MAVINYTQLKDQVTRFIHTGSFDADFDIFIGMVEQEIFNNHVEALNSDVLEITSDIVSVDGSNEMDLPVGLLSIRDFNMYYNGVPCNIKFKTPDQMMYREGTGMPSSYTIFANKIRFDIIPDEIKTFKMDYLGKFSPLTESNPTNVVLLDNANIYFYGCMWAAKMLEEELQDSELYYSKLIQAIKGTNNRSDDKKYANGITIELDRNVEQLNIHK